MAGDGVATDQVAIVAALHRAFHDYWTPGDAHSLDLYPSSELWVKQAEAFERIVAERVNAEIVATRDDIHQRIVTFRSLNADAQYLNALNDAWGIVANRGRRTRPGGRT